VENSAKISGVFKRGQSPLFTLKGGGWEKIKEGVGWCKTVENGEIAV